MRDPYAPWQDEIAAATPLPPPKNLDDPDTHDPPPDYQGAAKRGRAALNALMGWTQPTTPTHPRSPATEPHSPQQQPTRQQLTNPKTLTPKNTTHQPPSTPHPQNHNPCPQSAPEKTPKNAQPTHTNSAAPAAPGTKSPA